MRAPRPERRQSGVVLVVVLFFALLLTSSVATFLRRSTVDSMIARNRENSARAEALARGGVRLAVALVVEDKLREAAGELPLDTSRDVWSRAGELEIDAGEGASLRLEIRDAGSRLNLNALFDSAQGAALAPQTEPFLSALLEKVIGELPLTPAERERYDVRELVANLIDYVDADDVRLRGGVEDAYYQTQSPPYRAANRALLSVDELRLVEGFDAQLVEGLRPYVTVYPFVRGGGVNVNTAPPHVLALLYADDGVDLELADEDTVRSILAVREKDGILCPEDLSASGCTPIREIVTNAIYPPPTYRAEVFFAEARASVGDVQRSGEAVIDVSKPASPLLLSWRVR